MQHAPRPPKSNVIPFASNKKEPEGIMPPEGAPIFAGLKVKVALTDRKGATTEHWVEVANYPADGGLDAFYDLIHAAPDDAFMTADAQVTLPFAAILAIGKPREPHAEYPVKVEPTPGDGPKRLYARLQVLHGPGTGKGETVTVANVPWTDVGIMHLSHLCRQRRRCDFVTQDHGFLPLRGVKLEELWITPETPPRPKRLHPDDMLRPEDFPDE